MDATDYNISKSDANELHGTSLLPAEFRRMVLAKYAAERGTESLITLFSEFMGLANSVVANTREFIELFLVAECKMHFREAEKINLPTIAGALNGVKCAIKPVRGMCGGCAFRVATAANQSPVTSCDAEWSIQNASPRFMCHEKLDADGEPVKACAGWASQTKWARSNAAESK